MTVSKLGIILPSLYNSQLAYTAIQNINRLVIKNVDCCIFQEDIAPPICKAYCGVFGASEIFNYDGLAISTTFSSAYTIKKAVKLAKRILYIWEIEWLKHKNFLYNITILQDPAIELISPIGYADIIKNYCNRMPVVIDDLDIGAIYDKYGSN